MHVWGLQIRIGNGGPNSRGVLTFRENLGAFESLAARVGAAIVVIVVNEVVCDKELALETACELPAE